jgi:TonB family protein
LSAWNGKIKGLKVFVLSSLAVHVILGTLLLMCPKMLSIAQVYELELVSHPPALVFPVAKKTAFPKAVVQKSASLSKDLPEIKPQPENAADISGEADEVVYSLNQLSRAPSVVKEVKAIFPPQARAELQEGYVVFDMIIQANGKPTAIRKIESSASIFDEAAQRAVEQSEFRPGLKDGQEVAVRIQYQVRFQLR